MRDAAPLLPILLIVGSVFAVGLLRWQRVVTMFPAAAVGLSYRDGVFVRRLAPGRYARFDPLRRTSVVPVSPISLPIGVGEITVVTSDQFAFCIGLAPVLAVTDARAITRGKARLCC